MGVDADSTSALSSFTVFGMVVQSSVVLFQYSQVPYVVGSAELPMTAAPANKVPVEPPLTAVVIVSVLSE